MISMEDPLGKRGRTYSIQSARRITVGLHLNRCVRSIRQIDTQLLPIEFYIRETERAEAFHAERRLHRDVEVLTGVVAQGQEDLDGCLGVAQCDGHGEGGGAVLRQRDLRAIRGRREPAAWELCHFVLVDAAGLGVVELEVGGDQGGGRQGGEGEEGEMHCCFAKCGGLSFDCRERQRRRERAKGAKNGRSRHLI